VDAPLRTAMVLCAGLGTRLRPLTLRYPKPALPFFDGPLIRYGFALLKGAGIERVVINTHHLPKIMEEAAATEARGLGLSLQVSHEPVIQGTAGGVRDARRLLGDESFLLLNGDSFLSLDLRALVAVHRSRGDAATMAVTPMPAGEKFAAVEATPDGDVRRIAGIGEPAPSLASWHFLGAHVIEPSLFDFVPPVGEQDINRTVYLAMLRAGLKVRVCPVPVGAWADLGTPYRYLHACRQVLAGAWDLTALGSAAPRTTREGYGWVHPSAVVDEALLRDCVVCRDATVGHHARLDRVVVFPRTRIAGGEDLVDVIACDELRIATA
jgi:mannose-1-phosphate guanylyltransferase